VWRPALLAGAQLHFVKRGAADLDHWQAASVLARLDADLGPDPWVERERLAAGPATANEPEATGTFTALPPAAARKQSYATWNKRLASALYRDERLTIFHAPDLKRWSRPGQDEGAFRADLVHAAREKRDLNLEKLRKKYAPKLARLQERIARAEDVVARERDQARHQKLQAVVSVGATVLGALFGRKMASAGTVGRASTAARSASRASREERDVGRAEGRVEDLREDLDALQQEFDAACDPFRESVDPQELNVESVPVRPRKSDLAVEGPRLAWTPWWVSPEGIASRAF
jgi:hypothetical protein